MKFLQYFTLLILGILVSCTKPPDYPIEPVITFERLSRQSMIQGSLNNDSIIVTISFTDGDGDLGSDETGFDIYVKDTRLDLAPPTEFKLPKVPEQGAGNGISGEISILVFTTCCIFPDASNPPPACSSSTEFPSESVSYEIYIKDRAGHESNRIITDPVTLLCQ